MSLHHKDFMSDVPRGDTKRYLKQQRVPQARWQRLENIIKSSALAYDPENPGDKILVGAIGSTLIGISDNRHMLKTAGSRSGKSVNLINNLLLYPGSVLATDPKAELANITALRRVEMGQKVYVLDPFKYCNENIAHLRKSYNPLAMLAPESDTVIEDAGLIADALVVAAGKDPHWDESARNILEGYILHVVTCPAYKERTNLITVRRLINQALKELPEGECEEEALYVLEKEMLDNAQHLCSNELTEDLGAAIEGAARDFYEKSDKERDGVLSTLRRHTKFLDYKAMKSVLTSHDFDLADLKADPAGMSVYLCLPASRMGLCNRWLRIFINQLLDAMEREKTKPEAPVLVCLDEFPVLGHMSQLENAAGQIASFGVKLWVIIQDWNQGKALYGERWETFAGNAGLLQFFGNYDLATSEYISKRLGKTQCEVARAGEVGKEQQEYGLSGKSSAIELHDLLTPEEVCRLFARSDRLKRQLVMWAGYHPMILQRVEYFDESSALHHIFAGKYGRS